MPRIDIVEEAIIEADPSTVFEAILAEHEGAKNWWMPHWEAKPRGNMTLRQIGGIVDITVHRFSTPRFSAKSVEIVKDKLIIMENFEGDLIGRAEWSVEPFNGKTKVRHQWNVKTNRMMYSLFYPLIPRIHSDVMQKGFKALNKTLVAMSLLLRHLHLHLRCNGSSRLKCTNGLR